MSALHSPCANVPTPQTRQMNAFTGTMGDKTAMWPFAKLFWTFVYDVQNI